MTMRLHERIFELGDRAINIAVGPETGPPLILFHGVTRCWQTFAPILPSLMSRFEVYVVDFPGHGKSDRSRRGYRVADYVSYAEELLTTPPFSTKREIHLYGHSLGSMVAGAVAGRIPDRIHSVIMEDPPFHTMGQRIAKTHFLNYFQAVQPFANFECIADTQKNSLAAVAKQLADVRFMSLDGTEEFRLGDSRDSATLRFTAKCLKQLDPQVYTPIVEAKWLDDFAWQSELAKIVCPSLLLQADPRAGGMLTDEDAQHLEQALPECSLVKFNDVGHLIHWQSTESMLRTVEAFRESVIN